MPLKPPELKVANSLYNLARSKGLAPNRAREFVAAAYAESNLNPHATNKSSGAAGLFQLLSSGYRQKAQKLGGLYDPNANASAILPDYQSYWAKNPGAIPGAAARDVERSGMGAGFYSKPLGLIPQFGGAATAGPPVRPLPFNPARPLRPAPLPAVKGQTVNLMPLLKILGLGDIPGIGELASFTQPGKPAPLPKQPRMVNGVRVMPVSATMKQKPVSFAGDVSGPTGKKAVRFVREYLGTPYSWGGGGPAGPSLGFGRGASTKGFDCSSLLQYAWAKVGVKIPRVTYDQWRTGQPVAKGQLKAGDAVFFRPGQRGPEHVGMYIGGGKFIEAPGTGKTVRISMLAGRSDFMGARRFG